MDILTERGQVYQGHSERAVELFEACHGESFGVSLTDYRRPVAVDALLVRRDTKMICGVVEIKCREMSHETLKYSFNNEWLITMEKLTQARELAKMLGVPVFGWLYLIHDRKLLVRRLTGENGDFLHLVRTEVTTTQRSCNGGSVERVNAFIDMTGATVINGGKYE